MVFKLIRKLHNVVTGAIKGVLHKIRDLRNAIIRLALDTINGVKRKFENFIKSIFDGFQRLKDKADQIGVDVSDCIDDNENKIKQIASKVFLDTTSCITTKLMRAFEILNKTVLAVEDLINGVNDIQELFDSCHSIGCYAKVGAEATKLMVSLPLKATKLFLTTQQTIIAIQLEITACVGEKFLTLQELIAPAVNSVNECIANKIAGVTEGTTTTDATTSHDTKQRIFGVKRIFIN